MQMNILEQAKEQRTGVISQGGDPITILTENARGDYPLAGLVHLRNGLDKAVMWNRSGCSQGAFHSYNLCLWTMSENFPWDALPAWANACVYRVHSKWFCSSIPPEWDGIKEIYVHRTREHCTLELPDVVTRDILWDPSNRDSLSLNPERGEDGEV